LKKSTCWLGKEFAGIFTKPFQILQENI